MANIKIAVIDESTVVQTSDVSAVVDALQVQVHEHFAPVWGIDADLRFIAPGQQPDANEWQLVILDNSDQAGALGYHDVTAAGLPLGKVFAATDLQYGEKWSVTASHELLEMLGDPDINLSALVQSSNTAGTLYAYEVCDACESDPNGYLIGAVTVSDFVYPSWFESFWQTNGTQFDYRNLISAPFQLLPGGYIGVYDISSGSGWTQQQAEKEPARYQARARVGSRREKRRTPRSDWQPSEVREFGAASRKKLNV